MLNEQPPVMNFGNLLLRHSLLDFQMTRQAPPVLMQLQAEPAKVKFSFDSQYLTI